MRSAMRAWIWHHKQFLMCLLSALGGALAGFHSQQYTKSSRFFWSSLCFFPNRQDSQTRLKDIITGASVWGTPLHSFRTADLQRIAGNSTHTSEFLRGWRFQSAKGTELRRVVVWCILKARCYQIQHPSLHQAWTVASSHQHCPCPSKWIQHFPALPFPAGIYSFCNYSRAAEQHHRNDHILMVPQAIPVYVKFIKKIAWDKSSCVNIRYFIILLGTWFLSHLLNFFTGLTLLPSLKFN